MIIASYVVTDVNMFLKCSVIMLACSFSDPAYIISFPCTMRGFFGLLLFMTRIAVCFNLY